MTIDKELLAKAEAGDREALYKIGVDYINASDYVNAAKYWEMCADKGGGMAAYYLVRDIYGDRWPDAEKFRRMLCKMVDDELDIGWAKVMLGTLLCGSMRQFWMQVFDVQAIDGSFFVFPGIGLNPSRGINLIEEGMKTFESDYPLKLDWQDLDAVACAYRNRFQYVVKGKGHESSLYPPGYQPLEDQRRYLEYLRKAKAAVASDTVNGSEQIGEWFGLRISAGEGELASYETALRAKDRAVEDLKVLASVMRH